MAIEIDECLAEPDVIVIDSRPVAPLTPELCITRATRVGFEDNVLLVFSDFTNTANGMLISQIPLSSLQAPTDEKKASGLSTWLAYRNSEFAPGWSVAVYWQASHYGFVIYTDNGKNLYDDTGPSVGGSTLLSALQTSRALLFHYLAPETRRHITLRYLYILCREENL